MPFVNLGLSDFFKHKACFTVRNNSVVGTSSNLALEQDKAATLVFDPAF
jgi:hypothetical protein